VFLLFAPPLSSIVIIMKNKSIITSVLLLCILCVLSVVLVFSLLEGFASRRLLKIIARAQPGLHISKIKDEFGKPFRQTELTKYNVFYGNITNTAFCKNKILYNYYITPQCRVANIYTDTNGIIVFVSWKSL